MTSNVRIYASEQGASAADAALAENGFEDRTLLLTSAVRGREREAVEEAIENEYLPSQYRKICTKSLAEGQSLVAVSAPFGAGELALQLLENGDTVYTEKLLRYGYSDPAPLSNALGIPVLSRKKPSSNLTGPKFYFFGEPKLENKAAPLSSRIGMPLLTKPKPGRRFSFGLPLLINKAAPLSSLFALPLLTKPKNPDKWRSSFGFPLLSNTAAPLSDLLGMKVLSGNRRDREKR